MGIPTVQSMASLKIFTVFVLPIILSVTLATAVMADVLDRPNRDLQMWPQPHSDGHGIAADPPNAIEQGISIMGLERSYEAGAQIALWVAVTDLAFDCGDLYITIYDKHADGSGNDGVALTQKAFFAQCFATDDVDLPVEDDFTVTIDSPGPYTVVAEVRSGADSISALGEFVIE